MNLLFSLEYLMNEEHKSGNKAVGAFIQDNDGNFIDQQPDDYGVSQAVEVPGVR